MGTLDNYSLVFVIFINFFGQLEKYVNVEACVALTQLPEAQDKYNWVWTSEN